MPTIILSCTADEENGFGGVTRLTEQWANHSSSLLPRRPDAVIVMEPTGLDVVVAHKGVIRWKMRVRGRAAHSSCPQSGENAIYKMARVVTAIEQYASLLAGGDAHPRCGVATVSVGTIHGGVGVNTVPDQCAIEIDQRLLPGEASAITRQRLLDYMAAAVEFELEHEPPYMEGPSLSDRDNGPLAEQLSAVVEAVAGRCRQMGMPCCTNAPFYAATGTPTVIFGPGFLEQAHTADEWLPVEQLLQATEILYQFCSRWMSE